MKVNLRFRLDPEVMEQCRQALNEFGQVCRNAWVLMPRKKKKKFKKAMRLRGEEYARMKVKEAMEFVK